jgi:hypothetical protein
MKFILKSLTFLLFVGLTISCSSDSDSQTNVVTPKCTPIPCLNGGVSTPNCGCTCPQGYSGANCSTQITPSKITITKIKVKKFPNLNGTDSWDPCSILCLSNDDINRKKPDIYFTIENSSLVEIYKQNNYFSNALSNSLGTDSFEFTPTSTIEFTNVSASLILNLKDYDGAESNFNSADDDMGFAVFNLYSSNGGFPTTKTITSSNGSIIFEITLQYNW